jgi:hypothetical protein
LGLVGLLVSAIVAGSAEAQVLDRGELTGTVRDETAAALPGVTITLTQTETGFTRVVTTDAGGRYRAPLLPVGPYTIKAELANFATVTREGVVVTVGSAPVIDITMPLATVTEAVTVTAETPVVEASRAVISTTINQRAIATLPINGRDFRDFALLSPSAEVTPGLRSPIRFGGQQGDYSVINVDGADFTNSFFAEYTGSLETKNFAISQEAVQEFQILTNGFNAEFGRSTGGVINVVTKSGTNEIRGSGFLFLRDDALSSEDPFGNPPTDFSQQQFGGGIGGPIKQDKAFFFVAVDAQDRDGPLITRFRRNVNGVAVPEFGIRNLADLEGPHPQKQDLKTFFGRVDFDLTKSHRLAIRANYSDNDTTNFTGGRGQAIVDGSEDNFEDFTNEALSVVASLTSTIGTRAFNELKYQYVWEDRPREAKSDFPEVNIFDTGKFGREFFLPILGKNARHQFVDSFNYLFKNHDVKFGVDWNSTELADNVFIGFSTGTYFFNTLEDFQARRPSGLIQPVFLNGFDETNVGAHGYWQHELGFFIQDKWQPRSNLTVNFGIRYEAQWNNDPQTPIVGANNQPPSLRQAPGTDRRTVPQTIADDTNNWGPRLGISWDPTDDGKTVVRGGVGVYYGRTASIFMPTAGASQKTFLFLFPPPDFVRFPNIIPNRLQPGQPIPFGFTPSISFVAEDFQNPRVLNANVGFEREVANNLSLGTDFVYSRTDNARIGGFLAFDMNTLPPTGTDRFGRPIGVDAFFADTDGNGQIFRLADFTVGQSNMLSSLGRARYKAFTISLKKAFSDRTQFLTHYTVSKDESNADTERDVDVFLGPSNPFPDALEADYGIDERDIRHRFVFAGTVELGAGFTLSGITTLRSGRPHPAYSLEDVNGDNVTGTPGNNFDHAVDANGNVLPRFPFRQPNFYNVDLRLMWSRDFGKGGSLDLLFEIFNLLNNENLESRNFTFGLANFLDPSTFVGTPRTAQFGIKYRFGGR